MDDEYHKRIIDEIKDLIATSIKLNVNGKIDRQTEQIKDLNTIMQSFYQASADQVRINKGMQKSFDDYVISDDKWKVRAEPVVVAFERTTWLSSVVVQILKMLGLLGATVVAYMTVRNIFKP